MSDLQAPDVATERADTDPVLSDTREADAQPPAAVPKRPLHTETFTTEPRAAVALLLLMAGGPITVPKGMQHRRDTEFVTITTVEDYDALIAAEAKKAEVINGFLVAQCNLALRAALSQATK